ncbi:MAG: hypothetical protein CL424_20680 [Acidimicrobiaceae bacterium]|nr:hypothetical protein [Acidimicrobiaceae bacterium]
MLTELTTTFTFALDESSQTSFVDDLEGGGGEDGSSGGCLAEALQQAPSALMLDPAAQATYGGMIAEAMDSDRVDDAMSGYVGCMAGQGFAVRAPFELETSDEAGNPALLAADDACQREFLDAPLFETAVEVLTMLVADGVISESHAHDVLFVTEPRS